MTGGKVPPKALSDNSSSSRRKSRWESVNNPCTELTAVSDFKSKPKSYGTPTKTVNSDLAPNSNVNPSASPSQPRPPSDQAITLRPPLPYPDALGRPSPPAYDFHMLERKTIMLADGSVRSYFALPPDYQELIPPPRPCLPHVLEFRPRVSGFDRQFPTGVRMSRAYRPELCALDDGFMLGRNQDHENSPGLDGRGSGPLSGPPTDNMLKRKFGDESERGWREDIEEKNESERQRHQLLHYGHPNLRAELTMRTTGQYTSVGDDARAPKVMRSDIVPSNAVLRHCEVDQLALKKAFLHFSKLVNESVNKKKIYMADGKQGPVCCLVCGRSSKDFLDMHALIMHSYYSDCSDLLVDHLGLHKALCVLMGWNYLMPPDNSKGYQMLSASEAVACQDDLIMWPPIVIIHNTATGKNRDGHMEGLGNKAMDDKLRELGLGGGKAKSLYGKNGHLGVTLVKFSGDQPGLREALRLSEYFENQNHGRRSWIRLESSMRGNDGENNPNFVKLDEKTGERNRIFYGYLGTVGDLGKVDLETRKKVSIESRGERLHAAI